jgi:hypothetical protein
MPVGQATPWMTEKPRQTPVMARPKSKAVRVLPPVSIDELQTFGSMSVIRLLFKSANYWLV